ncbi:MAG: hypothetical protein EXR93_03095 [Gemmatimonadetes bacterium]|nr:hypothetical protein [Gemmatimonadota bacterium]
MVSSAQERVTIAGTVVDSMSGKPVERATVYLVSGPRTETDGRGRFQLIAAGGVLVLRRIGYAPRAVRLGPFLGASVDLRLTMTPIAVALDSMNVRADMVRINPRLADFYDRRRTGAGTYFTRDDIWKRNPVHLTDLVGRVPGISCGPAGCNSSRRAGLTAGCPMQVVIDGIRADLSLDEIPPAWVAGIEVYRGIATTPMQYGGTGRGGRGPQCGTIVIWTGLDK